MFTNTWAQAMAIAVNDVCLFASSSVKPSLGNSGLELGRTLSANESITIMAVSIIVGCIMRTAFMYLSTSISAKREMADTIWLVTISVSAIIAVVKSSLALSLGLVGALSVVRFRTAIKEPISLAFVLWTICVAIAVGAGQYFFSAISIAGGLAALFAIKLSSVGHGLGKSKIDMVDGIVIQLQSDEESKYMSSITSTFDNGSISYKLVNASSADGECSFSFKVSLANYQHSVGHLIEELRAILPDGSNISLFNTPAIG